MRPPILAIIGVGNAGSMLVGRSATSDLRQARYCAADTSAAALSRSSIIHRVLFPGGIAGGGLGGNAPSDPAGLSHSLDEIDRIVRDVDVCVIVLGMGKGTGGHIAPLIARNAQRRGCLTIAIGLFPFRFEGEQRRRTAARAMLELRRNCDYIFPFPLERLKLMAGTVLGPSLVIDLLYEHFSGLIGLIADVPLGCTPFVPRVANGQPCRIGTYGRHFPATRIETDDDNENDPKLWDPFLLPAVLTHAEDAFVLCADDGSVALADVDVVADSIGPHISASTNVHLEERSTIRAKTPWILETLSFGNVPPGFMRSMSVLATPASDREWEAYTLFREQHLDTRPPLGLIVPVRRPGREAAGNRNSRDLPDRLRRDPVFTGPTFSPGGFLDRLDRMIGSLESWVKRVGFAVFEGGRDLKKLGLRDGAADVWEDVKFAMTPTVPEVRQMKAVGGWQVAALVVGLIAAPFLASQLALETLGSIGRTNQLSQLNSSTSAVPKMQEIDGELLQRAAAVTPLTATDPTSLGLAAAAPSSLAAHLDGEAVRQGYFALSGFKPVAAPFDYVVAKGGTALGQIGRVVRSVQGDSDSTAVALAALGFTPQAEQLAGMTGTTASDVAVQLYELSGTTVRNDSNDWLAGCGVANAKLDRDFHLKELAPSGILLPTKHYLDYLARFSGGNCQSQRKDVDRTLRNLALASDAKFVPDVTTASENAHPGSYTAIVPVELLHVPPLDANKPITPLRIYEAGMRAFYLLNFSEARSHFQHLATAGNARVAALGSYLDARAAFWQVQLRLGSYRPDMWKPSNQFEGPTSFDADGDNAPTYGSDTDDESRSVEEQKLRDEMKTGAIKSCTAALPLKTRCVLASYRVDAAGKFLRVDQAIIDRAAAALHRTSIINPADLEAYDGTHDEQE